MNDSKVELDEFDLAAAAEGSALKRSNGFRTGQQKIRKLKTGPTEKDDADLPQILKWVPKCEPSPWNYIPKHLRTSPVSSSESEQKILRLSKK